MHCYYCELHELETIETFRTVYVRNWRGGRSAVKVCKSKADCESRGGKRVNVA